MFISFLILAIVVAVIMTVLRKGRLVYNLYKYLLVLCVGLSGIYGFTGHFFVPDLVAESIGWPSGNPFQQEVGFTNLSFGVVGLLCLRYGSDFRLATVIGYSIFLLGAAYTHLVDLSFNDNLSSGNAGEVLYYDILVPLLLIALAITTNRKSSKA